MRLYVFQLGFLQRNIPVEGYLIQTDDGTNILIDTGFTADAYHNLETHWAKCSEEDWVVNRLGETGLLPGDIEVVVCTHLDPDHGGSIDAFPNAQLVIQQAQYDAILTGDHKRFQDARAHWDAMESRTRPVSGDYDLLPGIKLVECGGHTPGHQAVLVRLPETGPVLLAGDALPHGGPADYTAESRSVDRFYDADEAATRASTKKLLDLIDRERVALIIQPHDSRQWRSLRKSPDYYT